MMTLKTIYADATHISCGYRFADPHLDHDQGYEDNGEIGQGRAILRALKDKGGYTDLCVCGEILWWAASRQSKVRYCKGFSIFVC